MGIVCELILEDVRELSELALKVGDVIVVMSNFYQGWLLKSTRRIPHNYHVIHSLEPQSNVKILFHFRVCAS